MSVFLFLREFGKAKRARFADSKKKLTKETFPLDIRPESSVNVDLSAQLIIKEAFKPPQNDDIAPEFAEVLDLAVEFPEDGVNCINAWSKEALAGGYIAYKFYLDNEGVLEVVTESDGQTVIDDGITYWSLLSVEYPTEAWETWLPLESEVWWIGLTHFPLMNLQVDDEGAWVGWSYRRCWSPDVDGCVQPVEMHESVHCGFYEDGPIKRVKNECMLYSRLPSAVLAGNVDAEGQPHEMLMLTAAEDDEGKEIQLWAGVRLAKEDLIIV